MGMVDVRLYDMQTKQMCYVATGVKVFPQQWQNDAVCNRLDAYDLNLTLQEQLRRARSYADKCRELVNSDARKAIVGDDNAGASAGGDFLKFVLERIESRPASKGTKKHYVVFYKDIKSWGKIRQFWDVDLQHIQEYDDYLHSKYDNDGTIYNYHKHLKAIVNDAVLAGKLEQNPYVKMRGKIARSKKLKVEYLTEEEKTRLERLEVAPDLRRWLDMFIVGMNTGLAFQDMLAFSLDKCKTASLSTGKVLFYEAKRVKTGVRFTIAVSQMVQEIMQRYGGQFPKCENQSYNKALKIIGGIAGITTPMHSHLARSTFATWMLSHGVQIQNVARMLGHTKLEQTLEYAAVLQEDVLTDALNCIDINTTTI